MYSHTPPDHCNKARVKQKLPCDAINSGVAPRLVAKLISAPCRRRVLAISALPDWATTKRGETPAEGSCTQKGKEEEEEAALMA